MKVTVFHPPGVIIEVHEEGAPPAEPAIAGFAATPGVIAVGQSVTLSGTITNAKTIELNGVVIPGLPQIVTPGATTTYTLVATGVAGTTPARQSLTVTVNAVPSVLPVPQVHPFPNPSRILTLDKQRPVGARYTRFIEHLENGAATSLKFWCGDIAGAAYPLQAPKYRLLIDGAFYGGSYTKVAGATSGTLTGTLTGAPPSGPVRLTIQTVNLDDTPFAGTECNVPFIATLNVDGTAKDSQSVGVQRNTWMWEHVGVGVPPAHATAIVPLSFFTPAALPLAHVAAVPFTTRLDGTKLMRYMLAPAGEANATQQVALLTTLGGVKHTATRDGYTPMEMFSDHAWQPNLDGARNVSTHFYYLYVKAGRNGKWYPHTPVSWVVVDGTGRRTTLFGKRDKFAPDWQESRHGHPCEELVGVCTDTRIPAGRAYLRNSWGGDWDHSTLALGGPVIGAEESHANRDLVWYATDDGGPEVGMNGFLWKLVRDGQDPNRGNDPSTWKPTVGSMFIPNLDLPRAVGHRRGTNEIIVNQMGANRIDVFNKDTGAHIRVLAQNTNPNVAQFGTVARVGSQTDPLRQFRHAAGHSPTTTRGENVLAPEGGAYLPNLFGKDWWVWGSRAQMDLRMVALQDGELRIIGPLTYSNQGAPGNVAVQVWVNDNTPDAEGKMPHGGFGPHGSVFGVTFLHGQNGRPQVYTPLADGTFDEWINDPYWHYFERDKIAGRGPLWSNDLYPTAGACGYGQMAQCTSMSGIQVYRQCTAAELAAPAPDIAKLTRGHDFFKSIGWEMLAPYGYSPNGQLPWGRNADCDYFLEFHGRAKP